MRTILLLAAVLVVALLVRLALVAPAESGSAELAASIVSAPAEPKLALERADSAAAESRTSAASTDVDAILVPHAVVLPYRPPTDRAVVVVRVTSVETGEPLAAVPLRVQSKSQQDRSWLMSPRTDADGVAELDVPAGERITVLASGDGARRSPVEGAVDALAIGARGELSLRAHTGSDFVVHGIVLASGTQTPIAGVLVEAVTPAPIVMLDPPRTTTANDGTFELALRSYATLHLEYSHARYGSTRSAFSGHGSPETPIVVLLEPSAAVQAQVIDLDGRPTEWWEVVAIDLDPVPAGTPVTFADQEERSGLSITATRGDKTSGTVHDGAARVEGLKAGVPFALEVRRGPRVVWRAAEPIVLARAERRAITITIGGAALHGFVRSAGGAVAPNVTVVAQLVRELEADPRVASEASATTVSDREGAYRLDGLEPGEWVVGTTGGARQGYERNPRTDGLQLERVTLRGGALEHDIVVAERRTITGRVVTASARDEDEARERIEVVARRDGDPSRAVTSVRGDGTFVLPVQGDGEWILEAHTHGAGTSDPVRARAGATDVVLRLAAGATLAVLARDERGDPTSIGAPFLVAADARNAREHAAQPTADGWEFHGLRPGTYHVVALESEGLYGLRRDVAVSAGDPTRVELVVRRAGRAVVRFDGPADSARLEVLDEGVVVQRTTVLRGVELEITGPLGAVEVRLHSGGNAHERRVVLGEKSGDALVFDGSWR